MLSETNERYVHMEERMVSKDLGVRGSAVEIGLL